MEIIKMSKTNFQHFRLSDIAAFSYAFAGAMGDCGGIIIVTNTAQIYYINYLNEDLTWEEVNEIIPMHLFKLPVLGNTAKVPDGW